MTDDYYRVIIHVGTPRGKLKWQDTLPSTEVNTSQHEINERDIGVYQFEIRETTYHVYYQL